MPDPSRVLALATLKRKGACADQLALFRAKFGAAVVVTEALCRKPVAPRGQLKAAVAPAEAAYQAAQAVAFARAYITDTI